LDPDAIRSIPELAQTHKPIPTAIPLWDGKAGPRAAAVIREFLAENARRPAPSAGRRS
jgi:hypothetical protein